MQDVEMFRDAANCAAPWWRSSEDEYTSIEDDIRSKQMVATRQSTLKQQITATLLQCGLNKSDFDVVQKMEHDARYVPTATKQVFGETVIVVQNLPAVLDHVEQIGRVYRVTVLNINDVPAYASISHTEAAGVFSNEL